MSVRAPRRRVGAPAAALAAALVLAGCSGGEPDVRPTRLVGNPSSPAFVLVTKQTERLVTQALPPKLAKRWVSVRYGVGTPDDVASTVKNGRVTDLVLLPAGAALARIRDELLQAPTRLGHIGHEEYYLAPVTSKALPYVAYYTSPAGRAAIERLGVRLPPAPPLPKPTPLPTRSPLPPAKK